MMKKILKIFVIFIAVLLLFLATILLYFTFRDHKSAHEELVAYLNKEFKGQVTFQDFSLSYFRKFPKVHVEVLHVSVFDKEEEIIKIGDLDLMLNLRSLLKKEIRIDHVVVDELSFFAITDSLGNVPVLLASKTPSTGNAHQSLLINARKIELRNSLLCFRNDVKKNRTWIRVHQADLKLFSKDSIFRITGALEGHLDSLVSNNSALFVDLPVKGKDIELEINRNSGVKELKNGYLQSNSVTLTPRLRMQPHEGGQLIELNISGGERFDALLALFRFQLGVELAQVNPDARLSLSYNQKGYVNPFKRPYSELDFEIKDAVFDGDDLPFPVELVYAKGNYNNGESHSPQTVSLVLDTLYASVKESHISGHIKLANLHDPFVDAYLASDIDLSHLIPENNNFSLKGKVDARLSVSGKLSELRKFHMEGKQQARGEVNVSNLDLVLKNAGYALHISNGTTTLDNHMIEVSNVLGHFNESAFGFQGHIENLDKYLLNESKQLNGKFLLSFEELDITKFNPSTPKKNAKKNAKKKLTANALSSFNLEIEINGKKVVTPWGYLKNLASDLVFKDDALNIAILRFDFQEGHIESSGLISFNDQGIEAVNADLTGNFKKLDFEIPKSQKKPGKEPATAFVIPEYINADVKLKIQQGSIEGIPLSNVDIDAKMQGREITLRKFHVNAFDGSTDATAKIRLDSAGLAEIQLDAKIDFNELKPEELLKELGLKNKTGDEKKPVSLPQKIDVNLDFVAGKLTYKDLSLTRTSFRFHADEELLSVSDFHCDFPFGQLNLDGVIRDYKSENIFYEADIVLTIDSLNISEYRDKQFVQALSLNNANTEKKPGKNATSPDGLPTNFDLTLQITADELEYDSLQISGLDLSLAYHKNKIVLDNIDFNYAGGKIHLNGHLANGERTSYPGYLYLNTQNLQLREVLRSFGNFNQDAFTADNSTGKISTSSHHYFELSKELEFKRDKNLWLVNTKIHNAEFHQVEPIEKTLFFVGHKSKDTMIVSELIVNLILAKDKIYFRDILMNDNIANLLLTGEIDLVEKELEIATEISLTDLFFRSRKERVAETQAGIITLDQDDKLFLRLSGPLDNHKIALVKKNKFENYRSDLIENIQQAEKEFRKAVK